LASLSSDTNYLAEPVTEYPWYALRVRSNFEKTTYTLLDSKGYEVFWPTYRIQRQRKDRKVTIHQPLFPGYVFCRFDVMNRLPILTTPGLVHIVGMGKDPEPVDTNELEAIRKVTDAGVLTQPWPFIQLGDVVRVISGPLSGMEGILVEAKNKHRLVLSISRLESSVSLEVAPTDVQFVRRGKPYQGEPFRRR
jgi:transcriptional antiterminator NusG